eukprot:844019_1
MGQSLFTISTLSVLTFFSTSTVHTQTVAHDYHAYLSKSTTSCSSATPGDTCTIHCDESPQYQQAGYAFDCGAAAYCTFQCEQSYCANNAHINATNVAHNLTVQSSGADCMRSSTIYLPKQGNARISNGKSDAFGATIINAGTNTQHVLMDCSLNDCIKTVINAQTAQSLRVTVGKGAAFTGQTGFLQRVYPAIINCPQHSHSKTTACVIDLSDGGSMAYTTINTLYGIPQDLSIKTGNAFNAVTLTCKRYGTSSVIPSNQGIDTAACNVAVPTPMPSFTTTPRTTTSRRPSVRPTLRPTLPPIWAGMYTTTTEPLYTTTPTLRPTLRPTLPPIWAGMDTTTMEPTLMEPSYTTTRPTLRPSLRPTVQPRYTTTARRETTVRSTSSTAKPTRRWVRSSTSSTSTDKPRTSSTYTTTEMDVDIVNATRFVWHSLVIPPEDTFKDVFLANLGFAVIALLVLCLCICGVVVVVRKRAQRNQSEEWLALV